MSKKTLLATLSGALAGGMIASCITLGAVGLIDILPQKKTESIPVAIKNEQIFSTVSSEEERQALPVEEIAKRVGPSIVGISCVTVTQSYFGTRNAESGGSGIIIEKDGHIVTNYHVVEGASQITVKLNTGSEYAAKVIGGDKKTDIAVIKIDASEELNVAVIGDSDKIEVGELAVAIGNPLASELFGTVTAGVISGVNRSMVIEGRDMSLIQTDAAISPGNSGGALINKYGEVIGINSVKLVDEAAEGLGFAIPMNEAVPIVKDLKTHGYVRGRPSIGVSVRELNKELAYYNNLPVSQGLYIVTVQEGSGAEKAGLQRGDIIVKINGELVTTSSQLNSFRDKHKAGDTINLTIMQFNGLQRNVQVTLTEDVSNKK